MKEFLMSLDWGAVLTTLWTVILLPLFTVIGKRINAAAKAHNIEKYTNMLLQATEIVVKDLQETVVNDIKGTDEWTDEFIEKLKEDAVNKAIASMSFEGYKILSAANQDFDMWLESIIKAKLYDLKNN